MALNMVDRFKRLLLIFPDTAFAWGTAVDTFGLDNVSAYTAASNEGGYVLGVIAAEVGGI